MRFGPNSGKLAILRRGLDADGQATGDFASAWSTWCGWTQNAGRLAEVNGQREDPVDLVVRVNDNPRNRTISNSDRAMLDGMAYEIDSVGKPERVSGSIGLTLRAAQNA